MRWSATELIHLIHDHKLRFFTTADIVTLSGINPQAATQGLYRLSKKKVVSRLKRGLWCSELVGDLNPFEAVPFLRAPWPAYVSLYSALADHGVVDEVPQVIYGIYAGQPQIIHTKVGEFHFHHLPPRLIDGYEMVRAGGGRYPLALPEKAFLDLVYLALTPRSKLQLPYKRERRWKLDKLKLKKYAARFKYKPLKDYLKKNSLW